PARPPLSARPPGPARLADSRRRTRASSSPSRRTSQDHRRSAFGLSRPGHHMEVRPRRGGDPALQILDLGLTEELDELRRRQHLRREHAYPGPERPRLDMDVLRESADEALTSRLDLLRQPVLLGLEFVVLPQLGLRDAIRADAGRAAGG